MPKLNCDVGKQWKVIYQKIPFNQNDKRCLLIGAEDALDAFAVAYNHLTNKGHCVSTTHLDDLNVTGDQLKNVCILPQSGEVVIRSIEPYSVLVSGRVVGE